MRARFTMGLVSLFTMLVVAACSSGGQQGTGGSGAGGEGAGTSQGGGPMSSTTTSTSSSATSSTGGSDDPHELCVTYVNQVRATKGFPPLQRWKDAEPCIDQQVTTDEMQNQPHYSWNMMDDSCNGGAQDECLGHGIAKLKECVEGLWSEKDLPACANCDACLDVKTTQCGPGCDFFGTQTGMVCGHYVNMAAKYWTKVACGFSALGGWDAINFSM